MEKVLNEDTYLTNYCMEEMLKIPQVVIYGCTDTPRAGTISFNIKQASQKRFDNRESIKYLELENQRHL